MKEVTGNIWDYYDKGNWIVITTNGTVKANGEAVMGRGVALQAKERFPGLALTLGKIIADSGNNVHWTALPKLIYFPVKYQWWGRADLNLIERSCKELVDLVDHIGVMPICYMVRPGCGNGGLDWKDVKPILEKYLDRKSVV